MREDEGGGDSLGNLALVRPLGPPGDERGETERQGGRQGQRKPLDVQGGSQERLARAAVQSWSPSRPPEGPRLGQG